MTKKWRSSTWGDEISLEYGKGIRGYSESNGEFRVFGSNGPIGWTSTPLAPGPGVVLGRKGAYRGVAFSERPFFVIDTAYYLVPKTDIDMRWLYYAVIHHKLGEIDDGSPIPSTTRAAVYVRPIDIPPIEEQKAISYILGSLDDLIETNRRTNETLEAMARAIFKDWFVDFGPVRAKAEGRAPYLAPEIWSLFPDALDDEDKPEGWKAGNLIDFAYLNPESWSRRNYPETIPYVDLSNTKWGSIDRYEQFSKESAPSRAQRILQVGDTIVGTVRPGNGSYAFVGECGLTGSTGFAVLRPKSSHFQEFVYLAATCPDNIERLSHLADGGAYPAVNPDVVIGTEISGYSNAVIKAFSQVTRDITLTIEQNKKENKALTQTRDFLLPKLMSGEIRVKDAEHLIQQAV